jgi:hypothetical protein
MNEIAVRRDCFIATCGGKTIVKRPVERIEVKSRWEGEVETNRQKVVAKSSTLAAAMMGTVYSFRLHESAMAAAAKVTGADKIREGFMQIVDVFTAIAEPILWFYALTACILMATGRNKELGWDRLKRVGYAYIFITLMPTLFQFLRWIAEILKGAIQL